MFDYTNNHSRIEARPIKVSQILISHTTKAKIFTHVHRRPYVMHFEANSRLNKIPIKIVAYFVMDA